MKLRTLFFLALMCPFVVNAKTQTCSLFYDKTPFPVSNLIQSKRAKANLGTTEDTAQININIPKMFDLHGVSNYNTKIFNLVLRELLQNSVDAIRKQMDLNSVSTSSQIIELKPTSSSMFKRLVSLISNNKDESVSDAKEQSAHENYNPKVKIHFDSKHKYIVVEDNGTGMDIQTIKNSFLTLGGSDKGSYSSGGFGIAKSALFHSSKKILVVTVKDQIKYEFLIDSEKVLSDPQTKIKITTTSAAGEKNGTLIVLELNASGGNEMPKSVTNTDLFHTNQILDEIDITLYNNEFSDNILNIPNEIKNLDTLETLKPITINKFSSVKENYVHESINFSKWGIVDVYVSKSKKSNFGKCYHLSHGIFQFKKFMYKENSSESSPYDIILDFKPHVKSDNDHYPFNLTRDAIKPSIQNDYDEILKRVQALTQSLESLEVKKELTDITYLDTVDISKRIKTSREHINILPELSDAYLDIDFDVASDVVSTKIKSDSSDALAPGGNILINHTNLSFSETDQQTKLLFSELSAVTLQIITQLKIFSNDYKKDPYWKKFYNNVDKFSRGIIINKSRKGVNYSGSLNAILLNPLRLNSYLSNGHVDFYRITEGIYATMLHEITHILVNKHDENFILLREEITEILAKNRFNRVIQEVIFNILIDHKQTYEELLSRYENASALHTSSLDDP